MSLLCVDVGNSHTVLATFDGDRVTGCWRVRTQPRSTADEIQLLWRGLLRDVEVTGVSACSTGTEYSELLWIRSNDPSRPSRTSSIRAVK